MNRERLKNVLDEMKVPSCMYNLENVGRKDERFCLEQVDDKWEVCYRERGEKTTRQLFSSESEACMYIYEQFKKYL